MREWQVQQIDKSTVLMTTVDQLQPHPTHTCDGRWAKHLWSADCPSRLLWSIDGQRSDWYP